MRILLSGLGLLLVLLVSCPAIMGAPAVQVPIGSCAGVEIASVGQIITPDGPKAAAMVMQGDSVRQIGDAFVVPMYPKALLCTLNPKARRLTVPATVKLHFEER